MAKSLQLNIKMKHKILKLSMVILFFTLIGAGCQKDFSNDEVKIQLLGIWIEKEVCNDGICDSILFKDDNTIELYFPFEGWIYHLPSDDSIVFVDQTDSLYLGFNFTLKDDNELIIYNFIDRSISQEIKNITFKKK